MTEPEVLEAVNVKFDDYDKIYSARAMKKKLDSKQQITLFP